MSNNDDRRRAVMGIGLLVWYIFATGHYARLDYDQHIKLAKLLADLADFDQ